MARITRFVLALPLYALAYVLVIPLLIAGCVLAAAIGVVFMALLLPTLVVLMIVGFWRPGALEDFFDWLGENNPVNVLMLLGPVHWMWGLAEKVDGRATGEPAP